MKYTKVHIDSLGYELAPVVVTSEELEARLDSVYRRLHLGPGQLQAMTGIEERRWWEEGFPLSEGAAAAARRALAHGNVRVEDLEVLIYAGVCRENFEPATACRVGAALGVTPDCAIYDLSNACLGVLNGIIDLANRIELGQIRAGMVVSCESARSIVEATIEQLLESPDLGRYNESLATLTGGSGAAAVVLTDGSFGSPEDHLLVGGVQRGAPQFHALCRWGVGTLMPAARLASSMVPRTLTEFMTTDSASVMRHGIELGLRTFNGFLSGLGWASETLDKVICHQVSRLHRETILKTLGIPVEKDFSTFRWLGNMGTVSLPMTTALASERGFLQEGHRVGLFGIGSGLNCMMLGVEW